MKKKSADTDPSDGNPQPKEGTRSAPSSFTSFFSGSQPSAGRDSVVRVDEESTGERSSKGNVIGYALQRFTGAFSDERLEELRELRKHWPEARLSNDSWLELPPKQKQIIAEADIAWGRISEIYSSTQVAKHPGLMEDLKLVKYALKIIRTQLDNRGVTSEAWYSGPLLR